MGALIAAFASPLISLLIPHPGPTRDIAILGLRLFAIGMIPCSINNALKNTWLGTGRVVLTEIVSLLEGAFFPAAAAFLFSRFLGADGALMYFAVGDWVTLLFLGILVAFITKKHPWYPGAALLLKEDFGVTEQNLLEMNIHTMEEVTEASRKAEQFCLGHGQDAKISNHIALCVEEMAGNTIQHGFAMDNKHHDLSVRLLHKDTGLTLRFRDDCGAFDPVHYIPQEGTEALGLRLVLAFAEDVRYTYAMNLNNVCIRIGNHR